MAVTQYIGAAYVAHGWTVWNAQTSYDNMYVVEYQNGNYISKKNVPAGNAPAGNQGDNEYWSWFGVKSSQIEEYRQEVITVQNNLNQAIINDNTYRYNKKDANIILLGDSYGTGVGSNKGWIDIVKQYLTNFTVYSNAIGGAGFVTNVNNPQSPNFLQLLKNLLPTIPDPTKINLILMVGGLNDSSQINTAIINAIYEFSNYVKNNLPNAIIYNIMAQRPNIFTYSYISTIRAISACSGYNNNFFAIPYANIINPNLFTQGSHLTDYTDVAKAVLSQMFGSTYKLYNPPIHIVETIDTLTIDIYYNIIDTMAIGQFTSISTTECNIQRNEGFNFFTFLNQNSYAIKSTFLRMNVSGSMKTNNEIAVFNGFYSFNNNGDMLLTGTGIMPDGSLLPANATITEVTLNGGYFITPIETL